MKSYITKADSTSRNIFSTLVAFEKKAILAGLIIHRQITRKNHKLGKVLLQQSTEFSSFNDLNIVKGLLYISLL